MSTGNAVPVLCTPRDPPQRESSTQRGSCGIGSFGLTLQGLQHLTSAPSICQCDSEISCATYKPTERSKSSRGIILSFPSLRNRAITDPAESVKSCLLILFLYSVPHSKDRLTLLVSLQNLPLMGKTKKS